MNTVFLNKVKRVLLRKLDSFIGNIAFDLDEILASMELRPFELHLELTNICSANCIFCPYQFQKRSKQIMSDEIFHKAVSDFVSIQGGSIGLTPIVGDPLTDPKFLERVRYLRAQPAIDRIFVTTNAILLDKFGIKEVLTSGIDTINISTASFNRDNYFKLYRSSAYDRMRDNVNRLVSKNSELGNPVNISIGLRTNRPISDVMKDQDFQPILAHKPNIDFTWSFTSAGGIISREMLPQTMKLRTNSDKKEACVNLFNGPIVLSSGDVLACSCVAAMDAIPDLLIGNILRESLHELYTGKLNRGILAQFGQADILNNTCARCDMYRNLELYRTGEGRIRAKLNRKRYAGEIIKRKDRAQGIFSGG